MSAPRRRTCVWTALWVLVPLLSACGARAGGEADVPTGDTPDVAVDPGGPDAGDEVAAPRGIITSCGTCHVLSRLERPVDARGRGPRDWMDDAGEGLVRADPAIPAPGTRFTLAWPSRGDHREVAGSACAPCHPVDERGIGHGLRVYPQADAAFSGGVSCASTCHAWLPADALVRGPVRGEGGRATWAGSLRPEALLDKGADAHAALWRAGLRPQGEGYKMTAYRPGCGGCHNAQAEAHGTIPSCLDCHTLGGAEGTSHEAHVARILDGAERLDVDAAAAGLSACAWCHRDDSEGPVERWRAACYGCHLSGHQVLDITGHPHLWSE